MMFEDPVVEKLAMMPKADHHAHGLLSCSVDEYRGVKPDFPDPPKRFHGYSDFSNFLSKNLYKNFDRNSYCGIARKGIRGMLRDNIVDIEVSYDITDHFVLGLALQAWIQLVKDLKGEFEDVCNVRLDLGLNQSHVISELQPLLEEAIDSGVFSGIDLYGFTEIPCYHQYKDLYRFASKSGLKLKAHVGEIGTAQDIIDAVTLLDLDAVQHGVLAAQCEYTRDLLIEREIPLNICPSSNVALGLCQCLEMHPIRFLFDQGLKVSVNSDDKLIFGNSASDEWVSLYQKGVFSFLEIEALIQSSSI